MFYICAIIKDEHEYIREWAEHNRKIGFDKIVLYDNNSSAPYDGVLGDMIKDGFIEIRPWKDTRWSRQLRAYNDFVFGSKWQDSDWCAFIDVDEFIYFDRVKTIPEFIQLYSDYAGVGLSWKIYNANGRIKSPKGIPLVEAYTTEIDYWEPRIKIVARLSQISCVVSPHCIVPSYGQIVTTDLTPIFEQNSEYLDYSNGHIKHFITKSWEDWVNRLKRGNITNGLRTVDTFFKFNPDMIRLRAELTKDLNYDDFPTINPIISEEIKRKES